MKMNKRLIFFLLGVIVAVVLVVLFWHVAKYVLGLLGLGGAAYLFTSFEDLEQEKEKLKTKKEKYAAVVKKEEQLDQTAKARQEEMEQLAEKEKQLDQDLAGWKERLKNWRNSRLVIVMTMGLCSLLFSLLLCAGTVSPALATPAGTGVDTADTYDKLTREELVELLHDRDRAICDQERRLREAETLLAEAESLLERMKILKDSYKKLYLEAEEGFHLARDLSLQKDGIVDFLLDEVDRLYQVQARAVRRQGWGLSAGLQLTGRGPALNWTLGVSRRRNWYSWKLAAVVGGSSYGGMVEGTWWLPF